MVQTIEAFVEKLQTEGVQEGQKQAKQICSQAQTDAEEVLAEAKVQAEKIIAQAKSEAENIAQRNQSELKLACRDTVAKLRQTLVKVLQAVLTRKVADKLEDTDFLGKLLHEIVTMYAKTLHESKEQLTINVQAEMRDKLVDWAIHEMGKDKAAGVRGTFDFKGTLANSGFEYSLDGATVEVTLESVVESLRQMISPALGKIIDQALEAKDS